MDAESIVYGCIRDWPATDPQQSALRRASNLRELDALASGDGWPFLGREMFSLCGQQGLYQTQVIHFGASYRAVEYEWKLWVDCFEALLERLYWSSAVVHLETELSGTHTFRWASESGFHSPNDPLRLRCAWEREGGLHV